MNEISLDDNTNLASEFLLARSMFNQIHTLNFVFEAVPTLTPWRRMNLHYDYGANHVLSRNVHSAILPSGSCPRNNV